MSAEELPFGLGCPECRYWVPVSTVDPDASLSGLYGHMFERHAAGNRESAEHLLARSADLTRAEAAARME